MLVLAILLALLGGNEKPAAAAPATAAAPANAAPSTATPAAPRAESRTLVGEILSVDVANRKVVMAQGLKTSHGKKGAKPRETLSVHIPYSTPLVRGKKAASLTDVKPRDHAIVRYTLTEQGAQALSLQVAEMAEGVGGS